MLCSVLCHYDDDYILRLFSFAVASSHVDRCLYDSLLLYTSSTLFFVNTVAADTFCDICFCSYFIQNKLPELRTLNPNTFFSVMDIPGDRSTKSSVNFVFGDCE